MDYKGHSSSSSNANSQRQNHWDIVLNRDDPSHRHGDSSSSSRNRTSSTYPSSSSSSRRTTRSVQQAVPIAPRGPVATPRDENDGYRFQCLEEGCTQRFRHRSSRSRHKRNTHGSNR